MNFHDLVAVHSLISDHLNIEVPLFCVDIYVQCSLFIFKDGLSPTLPIYQVFLVLFHCHTFKKVKMIIWLKEKNQFSAILEYLYLVYPFSLTTYFSWVHINI